MKEVSIPCSVHSNIRLFLARHLTNKCKVCLENWYYQQNSICTIQMIVFWIILHDIQNGRINLDYQGATWKLISRYDDALHINY